MEENVALDTSKQKKFVKSIKGLKKLIQKNESTDTSQIEKQRKSVKRKPRGLVYIGHIPHGFYEHQMTQYFKQFGVVTNARVIRSKRTGNSKGCAFVEFKDTDVAKIVADTMNNYLMGKRLIKAEYIPPEKQRRFALRKNWNRNFNPTSEARQKANKEYNRTKTDEEELKHARRLLSSFLRNKKRLSEMGINYDFFTPVDVPELLMDQIPKIEVKKEEKEEKQVEKDVKKVKKEAKKEKKPEKKVHLASVDSKLKLKKKLKMKAAVKKIKEK
ncbi:hypothetical protein ACJJTC_003039 [Scirpophaga incertulas]